MELAVGMKDRLSALKERAVLRSDSRPSGIVPTPDEGAEQINEVLRNADDIRHLIDEMVEKTQKLRQNHATVLSTLSNRDARECTEQLNMDIKRLSRVVHEKLKRMKSSLDGHESQQQLADYRIKQSQYATLSLMFKDAMEEYNGAQESFREKNKERIEKQLRYAEKDLTDDEVEAMLESNDTDIFTHRIILDTDTEDKRQALGEVEERHRDLMKLEEDIKELNQMFCDMSHLVNEQGEMINCIESNVDRAADFIAEGAYVVKQCVNVANQRPKVCCCF